MMEAQKFASSRNGRQAVIRTYDNYSAAEQAVDYLADRKYPVERVSIVADGLQLEEQVTGRLTWIRAVGNGALVGGSTGAIVGFVFGILSLIQPLVSAALLAVYGIIIGALIGAAIGAISHLFSSGKRDFTSEMNIKARRFLLVTDDASSRDVLSALEQARM